MMIKQYRHAVGQFFWEFAAGKIDAGETSLQTAKRELQEETGLLANQWRYLTTIHPVIGYADEKIDFIFSGRNFSGKSAARPRRISGNPRG